MPTSLYISVITRFHLTREGAVGQTAVFSWRVPMNRPRNLSKPLKHDDLTSIWFDVKSLGATPPQQAARELRPSENGTRIRDTKTIPAIRDRKRGFFRRTGLEKGVFSGDPVFRRFGWRSGGDSWVPEIWLASQFISGASGQYLKQSYTARVPRTKNRRVV